MIPKRLPRKMDPFTLLVLVVAIGFSATVAYQINLYHDQVLPDLRSAQNITVTFGQ